MTITYAARRHLSEVERMLPTDLLTLPTLHDPAAPYLPPSWRLEPPTTLTAPIGAHLHPRGRRVAERGRLSFASRVNVGALSAVACGLLAAIVWAATTDPILPTVRLDYVTVPVVTSR